jgi:hypothetical protein
MAPSNSAALSLNHIGCHECFAAIRSTGQSHFCICTDDAGIRSREARQQVQITIAVNVCIWKDAHRTGLGRAQRKTGGVDLVRVEIGLRTVGNTRASADPQVSEC